jgi:hypothetical protein
LWFSAWGKKGSWKYWLIEYHRAKMGKKQFSLFFKKYFELLLSMAEMGETIRIVNSDEVVVGDRNKSCGGGRRTESFHSTFRDQSLG